jgi:LacI family transcriptional regulator
LKKPARRDPKIYDIAAAAGVSPTTVSHVLNRVPTARVAAETRQRVERIASERGYAPNGHARALVTNRSNTLAILSDGVVAGPYAGRLFLGLQEEASRLGWMLWIVTIGKDPAAVDRDIRRLRQYHVDGIMYAAEYHRRVDLPFGTDDLPAIIVNSESNDASDFSIYPDEFSGGLTATRRLIAAGHRDIVFLNANDANLTLSRRGRLAGYKTAMEEAGLPYTRRNVLAAPADSLGGYHSALTALKRRDRPTALFCFTDRMAMGAYHAAFELGLRIPDDLSVVGYDNQPMVADSLIPSLTTVALPYYEMGVAAVQTLVELIRAKDAPAAGSARARPVAGSLVERHSVAAPRPV